LPEIIRYYPRVHALLCCHDCALRRVLSGSRQEFTIYG
jgi:hypothetical protein